MVARIVQAMNAARLVVVTLALVSGAALAQGDAYTPEQAERTYLVEPRHVEMPPYPMSANQAESMYGYPYPYVSGGDRPSSPLGRGDVAARRDSNPDQFATGIYNPKR
jgi:hypothetical protein